jgi:pyruvate/2-oxoglutarate dehydrogenase complex dihydrolipoamide acyltransferase (E2) component
MLSYYFVKIPDLPPEVQHRNRTVDIIEYIVAEGDPIVAGTPLARVENWWAVMEFDAVGPGIITKPFFDRGTSVRVGDPFAIIVCDPERAPTSTESARLRIVGALCTKPTKGSGDFGAHREDPLAP